jgi:23S rRNA (cytidine1920-2'-O)/16S rRNA (cytidine1409-2'-O)-methyltransferase
MAKERLDIAVFEAGLSESREKARALIMEGKVYVDGQKRDKPGMPVPPEAKIEVVGEKCPYVSRGGFKLEKALDTFGIGVENDVALDIGASTGGFTDCLLKRGPKRSTQLIRNRAA